MTEITDSYMKEQLGTIRVYSLVLLKASEAYGSEGSQEIIWEHGRRNFELLAEGKLAIVGPIPDDTNVCGMGIFTTSVEETTAIMAADPAVQAGIFTFDVHPVRSFPGLSLP
jgi:uncharacterized protein YciI